MMLQSSPASGCSKLGNSTTGCRQLGSFKRCSRRSLIHPTCKAAYRAGAETDAFVSSARAVLDAALFMPRALAGAALEASSSSQDVPVRRTPQDMAELAEAALVYAERGAQAEYEVFAAAAELVPPEMRSQLDNLLPWQLRQLAPQPRQPPTVIDVESTPAADDSVTLALANSPEVLLANQLAAELAELKAAVRLVHEAARALATREDAAQEPMLRLNLREARDQLSRRLETLSPQCSSGIGAAAAEEATFLLVDLDGLLL